MFSLKSLKQYSIGFRMEEFIKIWGFFLKQNLKRVFQIMDIQCFLTMFTILVNF